MSIKSKVIAVIPARGGSKSVPKKNIQLLRNHPLISYSIAAGLKALCVDRVIVSTDSEEIAAVARKYGAEVPFMRPAELAQDETPDFPVFEHVIDWLKDNEGYVPDIVVQLRPTSPIRPIGCIDEAVRILESDPDADSVRGVVPSGENPFKMWKHEGKYLQPLIKLDMYESYNMPRQKLPETFWHSGHIDVMRTSTIKIKKSLTGDIVLPVFIDPEYTTDIDTFVHLKMAEMMLTIGGLNIVEPEVIC
jgi:CMP-N-acetylneuraminic acid synthetase